MKGKIFLALFISLIVGTSLLAVDQSFRLKGIFYLNN
jgi:Na+/citrate or Na+/malate symporter